MKRTWVPLMVLWLSIAVITLACGDCDDGGAAYYDEVTACQDEVKLYDKFRVDPVPEHAHGSSFYFIIPVSQVVYDSYMPDELVPLEDVGSGM